MQQQTYLLHAWQHDVHESAKRMVRLIQTAIRSLSAVSYSGVTQDCMYLTLGEDAYLLNPNPSIKNE